MKETLKLGGILLLITSICAGLLGLVNEVTKPIIEQSKAGNTTNATRALLPEADDVLQVENASVDTIQEVYVAKKQGTYIGTVVKVVPKGYAGGIEMLVGIDTQLAITGVEILAHTETPGLGANAAEPAFTSQYLGKTGELTVVKGSASTETEIEAIAGATVTTEAITNGVNQALNYVMANEATLKEEGN